MREDVWRVGNEGHSLRRLADDLNLGRGASADHDERRARTSIAERGEDRVEEPPQPLRVRCVAQRSDEEQPVAKSEALARIEAFSPGRWCVDVGDEEGRRRRVPTQPRPVLFGAHRRGDRARRATLVTPNQRAVELQRDAPKTVFARRQLVVERAGDVVVQIEDGPGPGCVVQVGDETRRVRGPEHHVVVPFRGELGGEGGSRRPVVAVDGGWPSRNHADDESPTKAVGLLQRQLQRRSDQRSDRRWFRRAERVRDVDGAELLEVAHEVHRAHVASRCFGQRVVRADDKRRHHA